MSGCGFKEARDLPDDHTMCLLQCAHPPGQPLRFMWIDHRLLQEVQGEKDDSVMSAVRRVLHVVYPEESEG